MKAFVFKPTNESIGKFPVESPEDVPTAFQAFAAKQRVDPHDYLECSGRVWTVVQSEAGLQLEEGRTRPPSGAKKETGTPVDPPSKPTHRYRDAYATAKAIIGIGSIIKVLGIILAVIILLGAVAFATQAGVMGFVAGVIWAAGTAIPVYVLGILVSAQGQILKATLDTAVNTSPFLTDDERAKVMSLRK